MTNLVPQTEDEAGSIALFQEASVFDVARFEQVDRVANVMARASLLPDHLKGADYETSYSNCFVIANYAATVGMDPFMIAQASGIVYGKLVLEGKLVRAIIKRWLKFDLQYAFFGRDNDPDRCVYVADFSLVNGEGDDAVPMTEEEIEHLKDIGRRVTKGTFARWHSKNRNGGVSDQWAKDETKMFRERGSREWCREWEPGLMLGVYTPDEFDEAEQTSRSNRARDITPARNPLLDDAPKTTEGQPGTSAKQTQAGRTTSDKPSSPGVDGGAGNAGTTSDSTLPQEDNRSLSSAGPEQRNSTPQAGGSSPSASANDVGTIGRAAFEEFSGALARVKQESNLSKAKDEFFRGKGLKPNDKEKELFQQIYTAHEGRIKGNLDVGKVMAEIRQWVEQDVPEGERL